MSDSLLYPLFKIDGYLKDAYFSEFDVFGGKLEKLDIKI